jgi:dTDP-glucose pyrophosphorylase
MANFSDSTVRLAGTLTDAMKAIDRGGAEIALVLDEDGRLVGVMTDGDVRRALLKGSGMDSALVPHVRRDFVSVASSTPRAEVLDLMQALTISQIPIVGDGGRATGLHLLHEVLGAVTRGNWAVIMAGGRGTRLLPLTEEVPKPMLRVAGRPVLERIVLHLVGFGIRRIFIAVHYMGDVIESHFGDGSRYGCRIDYLREEVPLGTGGALARLPSQPDRPLIVMNGDLVTSVDFSTMLAFHDEGEQVATLGVRRYVHTVPFGCVTLDDDRVVAMEEKPELAQMVNAGIYVLEPRLLDRIPPDRAYALPELLQESLRRRELIRTFEIHDDWIDIGRRDQLAEARGG